MSMPDTSVAPHAMPGDDFQIVARDSDFPPDLLPKPTAKGKVAKDVTVPTSDLKPGDYWILVGDTSIGLSVGTDTERRDTRAQRKAQKEADALQQRNISDKEHLMSKDEPVDPKDQPSENRPPNPEDQPNELPIEDNTGTTRNPTGNDAPLTGPKRTSKKK